ncbi:uncharacterized protein C8A04DRAFT_32732 [Dichotomopilus funicola]|uniref:BTB domain-containing protein n=1 Tax=Dichotomopilus funicola TaxID=1934379 RepID=A0AAN6UVC2_9PEZI|nr:hypothetical protein C8A04DRAFT_32732 [Dichotomopilus funicola]
MEEARSWKAISASKLYRFLIGPEKKEFNIHAAIITQMYPVLAVFVNGTEFKEGHEDQAELEDVDEETSLSSQESASDEDFDGSSKDSGGGSELQTNNKRKKTSQQSIHHRDKGRSKSARTPSYWKIFDAVVESFRPPSYTEAPNMVPAVLTPEFSKILLDHARLLVFADCYQIAILAKMALFHLGRELQNTKDQPADEVSVEAIVGLLEFCYAEPRPGELRSLVATILLYFSFSLFSRTPF